jgi:hypothetical protein
MKIQAKLCYLTAFSLLLLLLGCKQASEPASEQLADRLIALNTDGVALQEGIGACVEDAHTGLTWEVKTDTPGLHDWRNTYSWFSPDEIVDELDYRGLANGGQCTDSDCDTWSFVDAVNAVGLCGSFDWRMPSRNELMSISDLSKADNPPTANLDFFPFTQATEYWTGFEYSTQYESAWTWNFHYGHDRVDWKKNAKFVRLVRGSAVNLDKVKD